MGLKVISWCQIMFLPTGIGVGVGGLRLSIVGGPHVGCNRFNIR